MRNLLAGSVEQGVPMGWPQMMVAGIVGALATQYVIHARSKEAQARVYDLVPRLFLLQALYEMQSRFPFLYKGEAEWDAFYDKIRDVLERNILVALGEDSPFDTRGLTKRVSMAVDRHLLGYLQKQTKLAGLLHEYLPASGQSWASFLSERARLEDDSTDSDDLSSVLAQSEEKRREALQSMRGLVCSFLEDLGRVHSSIRDATRGKSRIIDLNFRPPPSKYNKVKVFYATDRQVTEDGEYSGDRSERDGLHYGHMLVGIPQGQLKGEKKSPQGREDADPLKHMVILSINTELRGDKGGFLQDLNRELVDPNKRNVVLLFIHGYNVSHKAAIKSAAQLKHDLDFQGQTIAYTWSSKGTLRAYGHDERAVKKTVVCLQEFIKTIMSEISEDPDIHIVAHSMGNRALIEALHNIVQEPTPLSFDGIKNVVFAAADESRGKFENMARALQIHSQIDVYQHKRGIGERSKRYVSTPRLTVYSSTDDQALFMSMLVHGLQNRLGDTKSFLKVKKQEVSSDQVDVSGRHITKTWLQHSYYSKIPEVIQDIGNLLHTNQDAKDRSQEFKQIKPVKYMEKDFFAFEENEWKQERLCF